MEEIFSIHMKGKNLGNLKCKVGRKSQCQTHDIFFSLWDTENDKPEPDILRNM